MEPIKCWCEQKERDRIPKIYKLWAIPPIGRPEKYEIKYCPVCCKEIKKNGCYMKNDFMGGIN